MHVQFVTAPNVLQVYFYVMYITWIWWSFIGQKSRLKYWVLIYFTQWLWI